MRSRSRELFDRAAAAMVAAVEIYNKPGFPHKIETFSILAVNGWELLLKAKWLADNNNKERSLYVYERRQNKNGELGKKLYVRLTRSRAPFTQGLSYLSDQLSQSKQLDIAAHRNLQAMLELRDCATHFYSESVGFDARVYELGAACVKNFVSAAKQWFDRHPSEFDLYLLPLSFSAIPEISDGIVLNAAEKNFIEFLNGIDDPDSDPNAAYAVTIRIDIKFAKSSDGNALLVRRSNDPAATAIQLTEEEIRAQYPWDYAELTNRCVSRYSDFKQNDRYHAIRKSLENDDRFARVRFLDPGNPKSSKKVFFNRNILPEFDRHYSMN
ncbi:MAG: DUF3644 domain-containing protein [Chloroflexi bacterium]|nr:DUF3644 domain-containing protein [Chloroflexota bacterium]